MEIRALSSEERKALEDGLSLVAKIADAETPLSVDHVQEVCNVLQTKHSDFPEGVIAVGLALGQLIVEISDYEWVRVIDEYGEETALSPPGGQFACHPISMVQKRINQNELVDIAHLRDESIRVLAERSAGGDYDRR